MRWIRGPVWDICWIWSGLAIGVGILGVPLLLLKLGYSPRPFLLWTFAATVPLQMGHVLAPIIAAWHHSSFRRTMLNQKWQFIALPLLLLASTVGIGCVTQLGWTPFYDYCVLGILCPKGRMWHILGSTDVFPMLMWAYWVWNLWHFGRQNFGVLRLYRVSRRTSWLVGFGGTVFVMAAVPSIAEFFGLGFPVMLVMTGAVSINHWLVELGLTTRIVGHWWPVPALLTFGLVAFGWTMATPTGPLLNVVPIWLSSFVGLNFVHFLYDRWLYRFSDPQVRATIGRDIFSVDTATCPPFRVKAVQNQVPGAG